MKKLLACALLLSSAVCASDDYEYPSNIAYQVVFDVPKDGGFTDVIGEFSLDYIRTVPYDACYVLYIDGWHNVYFSTFDDNVGSGDTFEVSREESLFFLDNTIGECDEA
jgi:hypothetical protein